MEAPTALLPSQPIPLAAELKQEVERFAALLGQIEHLPLTAFEQAFYAGLQTIETLASSTGAGQAACRDYFRTATAGGFAAGVMQNRARQKPLGYAGDYLLIDWMYTLEHGPGTQDRLWDAFYHGQSAAAAVRNRKAYFADVFTRLCAERKGGITVLDLASGPCREVVDALGQAQDLAEGTLFHCVDIERQAVSYAHTLTRALPADVRFQWDTCNVLRLKPERAYDLVWAAGLFDYLNDRLAVALLARMWRWTAPGGRLLFGNFHPRNGTRLYMEWATEWFLLHRDEEALRQLALAAGIPPACITLDQEPTGVCIFCQATRPG